MKRPFPWSFKVFRIFGIDVRLHVFFVIFAVVLLAYGYEQGGTRGLWLTALWDGCLFLCILLHEFGHCWAAIRSGGRAESIVLWPLGGLATITGRTNRPRETIFIAAAGPAVNLILCIVFGVLLVLMGRPPSLNPLETTWTFTAGLFRLNYILLLFNLIPAFPLDGGRILQGTLALRMGYSKSLYVATWIGQVGAIILGTLALIAEVLMVVFIAIWVFIESGRERAMLKQGYRVDETESAFGYDFSQGYTSVEPEEKPKRVSWLGRRKARRRRQKAVREARKDAEIRRRVDELLQKVSDGGMESLTREEKRFLEEASRKFRSPTD